MFKAVDTVDELKTANIIERLHALGEYNTYGKSDKELAIMLVRIDNESSKFF